MRQPAEGSGPVDALKENTRAVQVPIEKMGRLMEMSRGSHGEPGAQVAHGVETIYTSAVCTVTWGGVRTGILDDERADKKGEDT